MDADRATDGSEVEAEAEAETDSGAEQLVEALAQIRAEEHELRAWLRAITPLFQIHLSEDSPVPDRVRFAVDRLWIAACERAARILRSDISADDSDGS